MSCSMSTSLILARLFISCIFGLSFKITSVELNVCPLDLRFETRALIPASANLDTSFFVFLRARILSFRTSALLTCSFSNSKRRLSSSSFFAFFVRNRCLNISISLSLSLSLSETEKKLVDEILYDVSMYPSFRLLFVVLCVCDVM